MSTRKIDDTALQAKVEQLIAENPYMNISVSAVDLTTGATYHYGNDSSFVAASITKLLTACLFLHQIEAGNYTLTDSISGATVQQQIKQMIVDSDNTAWKSLNDTLVTGALETYATKHGLQTYNAEHNTISSDDTTLLLAKLYRHKLLNELHTSLLLSYMQQASETDYIVVAAPTSATVYHKAGWLDDRMHDAAIIDNGTHAYALAIFTATANGDETYNSIAGKALFYAITSATNAAFLTN